jgi:outer membrane autotransporter protein
VFGNSLSIATDADFKSNDLGKSANQRSVAGHLQRIWDSGAPGFDQGFFSLSRLSDTRAYTRVLDSLSGEVQASAITAEVQTAFFVQEAILDHLRFSGRNVSSGLGPAGTIGSRFAPGTTTLTSAYSADLRGNAAPSFMPVQPAPPAYTLWGQAFGAFGETRSNGNAARLSRQIGGFVLGAEIGAGVLADWRVGLAGGYSFTSFDVTARQSTGSVESGFGAIYARGPLGPLQMRLGAAYAGNTLDTRRAVLLPGLSGVASGKADGDTVQGFGEVGYRIGLGQGYIEPFVGAAAIRLSRDDFSEVGGAAALSVFGRSYEVETITAGLQGQAVLSEQLGTGLPIVARGLIAYRRAFGDVEPRALQAFGGAGQAFLTTGVPIARDALVASAGLDVQIAPLVTIGVNYTGQVGDRAQDHAVKGVFSYRW